MTAQRSTTGTLDSEDRDGGPARDHATVAGGREAETEAVGTEAELLAMKVSDILEARPAALDLLIAYGFTPLKQPHLRAILAHTVTLSQALRIRSQSAERERALMAALVGLFTRSEADKAA